MKLIIEGTEEEIQAVLKKIEQPVRTQFSTSENKNDKSECNRVFEKPKFMTFCGSHYKSIMF